MKEYKAEDTVVAFIDILGSSEEMKRDPQNVLNTVHNAYDDALESYNTILKCIETKYRLECFQTILSYRVRVKEHLMI